MFLKTLKYNFEILRNDLQVQLHYHSYPDGPELSTESIVGSVGKRW